MSRRVDSTRKGNKEIIIIQRNVNSLSIPITLITKSKSTKKVVSSKKKQSFQLPATTAADDDKKEILQQRASAQHDLIAGLTVKQKVDAAHKIIETYGFAKDDIFNDKKWKELFSGFGK